MLKSGKTFKIVTGLLLMVVVLVSFIVISTQRRCDAQGGGRIMSTSGF